MRRTSLLYALKRRKTKKEASNTFSPEFINTDVEFKAVEDYEVVLSRVHKQAEVWKCQSANYLIISVFLPLEDS